MSQYDTVILGFPIWWYTAPTIIKTFLESYDFSGKKIAVFATSGGSGLGKTVSDLTPCVSENADFVLEKMMNRVTDIEIQNMLKTFRTEINNEECNKIDSMFDTCAFYDKRSCRFDCSRGRC